MTIDKQALRQLAERATKGPWRAFSDIGTETYAIHTPRDKRCGNVIKWAGFDCQKNAKANAEFIAAANPATVLALLDELEAAEKRNSELSKTANVNRQWKPHVCPITGRKFFMWIEHETLGYVPTYGGPFDSYTIPTRDSSGEFSCERYDHDIGGWVDGEFIGLYLIDDDEQCRVCGLEERIAELEARAVNLPKRSVGEVMHMSGFSRDYAEGWCVGNDNAIHEIRTAGIKAKEL
ncbi:ead/Ea22-like family protein [Salmonella enterica]|nr:ead/Ea22-like family protein [Salmonella enterica]EBY8458798.1 ead/Ea22-like family protein [Salmonella enterica subsp. enterica serovar Typhimurium]ECF3656711.1 ead/Ea22-like family protein [Salmonella enterica subsp. enterica serovar Newport]ECI2258291.1 ead/Ea22-like family protein [Salmonella enterica subsp. enterica]ECY4646218.1 ead/Ea22-like family protein [Salmonella enterica subsp. enterica serovar Eastbourne]